MRKNLRISVNMFHDYEFFIYDNVYNGLTLVLTLIIEYFRQINSYGRLISVIPSELHRTSISNYPKKYLVGIYMV